MVHCLQLSFTPMCHTLPPCRREREREGGREKEGERKIRAKKRPNCKYLITNLNMTPSARPPPLIGSLKERRIVCYSLSKYIFNVTESGI